MRRDFMIAILLAVSAIPVGVALMAAPLYFDFPKSYLGAFFWGGLLSAAALIVAAVVIAVRDEETAKRRGQKRPMLAIAGMIVFGIGFLGCAAWYFWPGQSRQNPAPANPLDNTVMISCENAQVPDTVPANGWNDLYPDWGMMDGVPLQGGGIQIRNMAPGSKLALGDNVPKWAPRCRIVNYGQIPLLNVRGKFILRFAEQLESPIQAGVTSVRRGRVLGSYEVPIQGINIDPGADNAFEFYVFNQSVYQFDLLYPKTLEVQLAGQPKSQSIRLMTSEDYSGPAGPKRAPRKVVAAWVAGSTLSPTEQAKLINAKEARVPVIGSLVYQDAVFQVDRKVSTKQTHVTMFVRLRNSNAFLVKFHARLEGLVGDRRGGPIEFDGFISPSQTNTLTFTRMNSVPVNEDAKFGDPVLSGQFRYDVTYWNAEDGQSKRRTARTCLFNYFGQLSPPEDFKPGSVKRTIVPVTVQFRDEVEE